MEKAIITGGAGFIGSHLSEVLLSKGMHVVCVDDFTLGSKDNVSGIYHHPEFELVELDVSDAAAFSELVTDCGADRIYHLAANSDIQKSSMLPDVDYVNTFGTTHSVLEAMRKTGIKKLFFASTSAVYGEKKGLLSEGAGDLRPISYYGAAKLASEAYISAYAHMNDLEVLIFRFPNVIGPHLTHGVIFDFIRKLKANPLELEILGDGTQCKPYLYVSDLVDAIYDFSIMERSGVDIFNIGVDTATTVNEIADMVCERMHLNGVTYKYTGGNIGWKGDVPAFQYDLKKIKDAGWKPKHDSNESVRETLEHIEL